MRDTIHINDRNKNLSINSCNPQTINIEIVQFLTYEGKSREYDNMENNLAATDILIVDDDPTYAEELCSYLLSHGLDVSHVASIEEATKRIAENPPYVLVLDQFIGSTDTLGVLNAMRRSFHGGLMVLTGNNDETDRVVGLELGADDFVSKLVSPREVLARLRSLLRSHKGAATTSASPNAPSPGRPAPVSGRWSLNLARHELFSPDGALVHLTSAEFATLRCLSAEEGSTVSRDDLSKAVLRRPYHPLDRSIDNLVSRLRKKLEDIDPKCRAVKSVRGEGYVFVGFDQDDSAPATAAPDRA